MGAVNRDSIIIIDNSTAITGALKAIVNATTHLQSEFHFIYVLPRNSKALSYLHQLDLQVEVLPFVEISKRPTNLFNYFPCLILNGLKLKKLVAKHNVKVVHTNDFYNLTGIVAKYLGADIKLITHVRFLPQKFTPALAKTWAKLNLLNASYIICVSEAVKSFFKQHLKVLVIPDTIPAKEQLAPKVIQEGKVQAITLLYLSNFINGKGQNYALEAFGKAYNQNKNLRLIFAGGDMGLDKNKVFRQKLEQQTYKAGLQSVVSFEPFVQDVEAKIKESDIVLNFSESESFSLTCLDALYYGTPLIASDCGGPAELFQNNRSGLLVPNKDVDAMVAAILELASNLEKRKLFSKEGMKFVREKFGPENSYLQLRQIYDSLLSKYLA